MNWSFEVVFSDKPHMRKLLDLKNKRLSEFNDIESTTLIFRKIESEFVVELRIGYQKIEVITLIRTLTSEISERKIFNLVDFSCRSENERCTLIVRLKDTSYDAIKDYFYKYGLQLEPKYVNKETHRFDPCEESAFRGNTEWLLECKQFSRGIPTIKPIGMTPYRIFFPTREDVTGYLKKQVSEALANLLHGRMWG